MHPPCHDEDDEDTYESPDDSVYGVGSTGIPEWHMLDCEDYESFTTSQTVHILYHVLYNVLYNMFCNISH